jgi:ribonuclease E
MAGGPATVEEPTVEEEPDMMLELDEEVIRMTDTAERPAFRSGMRPGMPGFPAMPERPVGLARRSASPPPARVIAPVEPPPEEVPAAAGTTAAAVTPGATVEGAGPADASPAEAGGPDEARNPRRRRGRRGGRRGRGRGEGGGTPNASGDDAPATGDDEGDES